jgi:hypothetical protein
MPTWPLLIKASATTTAADTNSISGARGDINQTITNLNTVIDTFNIGTPGSGDDNKVLTYDHSTGYIVLEANSSAQTPFAQEVDQNGFMLKDDSRDYQILGNTASPSATDFDSFSNTNRVHGVVNVNKVTNPVSRVHSNPRLSMVVAGADAAASGPTANIGRLRQNYVEGIYDMAGFDNLTNGFGRGHNGMFVSGLVTNSSTTTSNLTESTAITITPQIDTVDANAILVTDMAGLEVQGYCNGVGSSATNFYGFYYNAPDGDEAANLGTSNHYSFYGADANATLYNAGPLEAKGLKYPTSDGTTGQILKTDGSGNLSFGTSSGLTGVQSTVNPGAPYGTADVLVEPSNTNGDLLLQGNGTGEVIIESNTLFLAANNNTGALKIDNSTGITRDGSGSIVLGGSATTGVDIDGPVTFDNQTIGGTPVTTGTPAAWLSTNVNGGTYYIPLYQ